MGSHTVQTLVSTQDISPLRAWKGGNIKSNHPHSLFGRTQSCDVPLPTWNDGRGNPAQCIMSNNKTASVTVSLPEDERSKETINTSVEISVYLYLSGTPAQTLCSQENF